MQQCETSGGERCFEGEEEITFGVSCVILKLHSPSFTENFFGCIKGLSEA